MNYVALTFFLFTLMIVIGGGLINTIEKRLPKIVVKNFRYGKFGVKDKSPAIFTKFLEIPKSWFKHYYLLALSIYTYLFYIVSSVYIFDNQVPSWFTQLLNVTCGENRNATTSATQTYIAFFLLTLQVIRRFYDTHVISVFSKGGKMSLLHYVVGLVHYPGCALAILCESPKFSNKSSLYSTKTFAISDVSIIDIGAIILFLWAWWHQHVTTKILANLRKDKKGKIISDAHNIPHGDWFDYLTAPHQVAEIIMYIVISILLWGNTTWLTVLTWVASNQIETILLTHWWYQETFSNFPRTRCILIPFVY